jgi:YD repeat-containing protein
MKKYLLFALIFSSLFARSQFYYNDIIGTNETNAMMKSYADNHVQIVRTTGITPEGSKVSDYTETREVKENGKALRVTTINELNRSLLYTRFDDNGRVSTITDSSSDVSTVTTYSYDQAGRISTIQSLVNDPSGDFKEMETHTWIYNKNGQPEKMWKIRSQPGVIGTTDSLEIRFVPDEKGNPGEEHSYRKGYETDMLYYYFDEKNRVTDIVRYNKRIKKLVPDFMFTYDDQDHVIQKITSSNGDYYGKITWVGYMIWRYIYNEKGLKTKEALFNNAQELQGKIEYSYSFSQ